MGDHGQTKKLVWGVSLMAVGVAYLLDRYGVIEMPHLWNLWTLIFFPIGIAHIADRRPGSGIMLILIGIWFLACNEGWMGLDYGNSWPLLLVAMGISIVIRALTREDARRQRRGGVS